jgi:hypothetical protein
MNRKSVITGVVGRRSPAGMPALRPRAQTKRPPNGCDCLCFPWKPAGILLGHGLLTDPHRELTTAAHHEFGFNPGRHFDERSHTDRAGQVVSNLAVTNADALHAVLHESMFSVTPALPP